MTRENNHSPGRNCDANGPSRWYRFTSAFDEYPQLQARVSLVLDSLPSPVIRDFEDDQSFAVTLEQIIPGRGASLFMALPRDQTHVSRCVVLRKKLDRAPADFAQYIIAHEFAHAYLRNGGWNGIEDKEEAADALAASWGFAKPKHRWFQ